MPAPSRIDGDLVASPAAIRPWRGVGWILLSCLGATAMSVAVRLISGDVPVVQVVFLRSALGLWVLVPFLMQRNAEAVPKPRFSRPGLHLMRGILMLGALTGGYFALSTMPLATATTLFFLAPVFATAGAALFVGERVGPRRWAAVLAAFIGALVVLRPGFGAVSAGMLAAVASAACYAAALLSSRTLSRADGTMSILLSSTTIATIALAIPALMVWQPMTAEAWGLMFVIVATSSLRMYADISAYSVAEAGFLAPFAFLRLLFIAAAGWVFFREGLDGPTLIGALIIIGATVFIALRERQLSRVTRNAT